MEAKMEYDEAIRLNDSDARSYANRAAALIKLNDFSRALEVGLMFCQPHSLMLEKVGVAFRILLECMRMSSSLMASILLFC